MSNGGLISQRECALALFRLLPSGMTVEERQESMDMAVTVARIVSAGTARAKGFRDEIKRVLSHHGGRTIFKHRRREALDWMTALAKLYREEGEAVATVYRVYPTLRGPVLREEICRPLRMPARHRRDGRDLE